MFFGFGTDDPNVPEFLATDWIKRAESFTGKNIQFKKYDCLGHQCSDEVHIYFILLRGLSFLNITQRFLNSLLHRVNFYYTYSRSFFKFSINLINFFFKFISIIPRTSFILNVVSEFGTPGTNENLWFNTRCNNMIREHQAGEHSDIMAIRWLDCNRQRIPGYTQQTSNDKFRKRSAEPPLLCQLQASQSADCA